MAQYDEPGPEHHASVNTIEEARQNLRSAIIDSMAMGIDSQRVLEYSDAKTRHIQYRMMASLIDYRDEMRPYRRYVQERWDAELCEERVPIGIEQTDLRGGYSNMVPDTVKEGHKSIKRVSHKTQTGELVVLLYTTRRRSLAGLDGFTGSFRGTYYQKEEDRAPDERQEVRRIVPSVKFGIRAYRQLNDIRAQLGLAADVKKEHAADLESGELIEQQ